MSACSAEYQRYLDRLQADFESAYAAAKEARAVGLDPSREVEIPPAQDVAARVEGLVGPKGVAQRIRELAAQGLNREQSIFALAKEHLEGKGLPEGTDTEKRIEQAVRSGLALFTEGVVSAPIEGVSKVKIGQNPDGSSYLSIFFTGPIRGAGGTGQAFTLLLGDYCRQLAGLGNYRPTEDEVERYVEESNLYAVRTRAGQYVPTADEVRLIARNCAVCIDGEPTEDYEVGVRKNLARVATNRVRGGLCLVLSEGLCLKASKVLAIAKRAGLQNWGWIEGLIKVSKADAKKTEIKPVSKYLDELVAGRPIFAYPMRAGAFSLRYGRTRFTGIASKAVHPATMAILQDFPVIGTQVKLERPGKGCIFTPCEEVEGPVVKLQGGEVRRVESHAEALAVRDQVEEILSLGELLANFGDFLKSNHPIVPGAWCLEWFEQELEAKGHAKPREELQRMGAAQALELARTSGVPLHPRWTYHWHDLALDQLRELGEWLATGSLQYEWFDYKGFRVKNGPAKRWLELACVPHRLEGEWVVFDNDHALALLSTLGLVNERALDPARLRGALARAAEGASVMAVVNAAAGFPVQKKVGTYVGGSMGRPEKSKPRQMKPPVHVLFPIGTLGGLTRGLLKASRDLKADARGEGRSLEADLASYECPSCRQASPTPACPRCRTRAELKAKCVKCGRANPPEAEKCSACGSAVAKHGNQVVDLPALLELAQGRVKARVEDVKGVMGLISAGKVAEPLEKGLLRAKHGLTMFRDGTVRFDATEVPLTHFIPRETGTSLEKLRELGYEKDLDGKPLERDDQVVELRPQDIIVCENNGDYFVRIAQYVDDLLVYHYGRPAFYNLNRREDLVGHLAITIAPHISAGTVCRIIGFTKVRGQLMHPYLHCGIRRNCDGDESCLMLLLDALVNFSKSFLPETRGGSMDAPLVLTVRLDPTEIDDEAHAMDACARYPLELYRAGESLLSPSEVKGVQLVKHRLGKPEQYEGLRYTHAASLVGPVESSYVSLGSMPEKLSAELSLMLKIRAVDTSSAVERIIQSHFFPDLYGNLRQFTKQIFRCISCTQRYRRIPLTGKCSRCGGKLILTITKGGIEKYLKTSQDLATKYNLPPYLKQRLTLIEKEIDSIFEDDQSKQFSLAEFV
jgi:DNA polymerase II large subunit